MKLLPENLQESQMFMSAHIILLCHIEKTPAKTLQGVDR
jgi:hypothetical protein